MCSPAAPSLTGPATRAIYAAVVVAVLVPAACGQPIFAGLGEAPSEGDAARPSPDAAVTESGGPDDRGAESVDGDTPASIAIDPSSAAVAVGTSRTLRALASYKDGASADVSSFVTWTSDAPAIATVDRAGRLLAVAPGGARVRATLGPVAGEMGVVVVRAPLIDLRVDPGVSFLPAGSALRFTATGVLEDGTKTDLTARATWTSDSAAIARFTATGVPGRLEAVARGDVRVSAAVGDRMATARVSVFAAGRLSQVEVSPTAPIVAVGTSAQIRATAIYEDGTRADVTDTATWTTSEPAISTVSSVGLVAGVAAGVAVAHAEWSGRGASALVRVTDAKLVGLSLDPLRLSMTPASVARLAASATFADDAVVDVTASSTWRSDDPTVATALAGMVTASRVGTTNVAASFRGAMAAATVAVVASRARTLSVSPAAPAVPLGTVLGARAVATFDGDISRDVTADAVWSIDDATVATVSNAPTSPGSSGSSGNIRPIAVGRTTLRATLPGIETSVPLVVTRASVASIRVEPATLTLVQGVDQALAATARYDDGRIVDVAESCVWITNERRIVAVSNAEGTRGIVTGHGAGSAIVACSLGGVTGRVSIDVPPGPLSRVDVTPASRTCRIGETVQFTATAVTATGATADVSPWAAWASSDTTVLQRATTTGTFRCVAVGTPRVSATYGSRVGVASVRADP